MSPLDLEKDLDSVTDFNVAIIGGGPGGYTAAIRVCQLGGKAALIEKRKLGGVCTNEGCIPTKFFLEVAEILSSVRKGSELGLKTGPVELDMKQVKMKKDTVVKRLVGGINLLLQKAGVQVFEGEGVLIEPNLIEVSAVGGKKVMIRAENIIIATGSSPSKIPAPGVDGEGVMTSDDALELETIPKSIVIVGGGPEGVEFADIFRTFGASVSVIEMMSQLLPLEDAEVAAELRRTFERKGIKIYTDSTVIEMGGSAGDKYVRTTSEHGETTIKGDFVLLAAGRRPNVHGLGLEKIGVKFSDKGIETDDRMRTNLKSVYAIGDVAGKWLLAYTASEEGVVAADNALGGDSKIDYTILPRAIFTRPEVAAVGLTQELAVKAGYKAQAGKFPFRANGKAILMGKTDGFVKIIADEVTDRVLGVHIMGPHAAELIHQAVLALKMKATVKDLSSALYVHPTLSEALKEAALDIYQMAINKPPASM